VVEWEHSGDGVVTARLHGPIEAAAAESLRQSMSAVLLMRPPSVVFDYRDVPYVSSTGWGLVAACFEACHPWNGTVALFGLNADLFDIYACLELNTLVAAHGTEAEALRAVRSSPAMTPPEPAPEPEATQLQHEKPLAIEQARADGEPHTAPDADTHTEVPDVSAIGAQPVEETETRPIEETADEHAAPPEVGNWRESASADVDEDEPSQAEPSPLDRPVGSDSVDVDSARADKNVGLDRKIRQMGWGEYGERLRRIQRRERGDPDPDEDN
jgi:anti-anti-sigma factor